MDDASLKAVEYLVEPWRSEVLMDAAKLGLGVVEVAPGGDGFSVKFSDGQTHYYDNWNRSRA